MSYSYYLGKTTKTGKSLGIVFTEQKTIEFVADCFVNNKSLVAEDGRIFINEVEKDEYDTWSRWQTGGGRHPTDQELADIIPDHVIIKVRSRTP